MRVLFSLIVVVLLVLLGANVNAELKIPSSVYTMEELEEAKAEAAEDKEPLVFVLTNPGST